MTTIGILAGLLPQSIMNTQWFAVLSMFVAINTLLYLTVAIVKLLPKVYLSDWVDRGNRRSETRHIDPTMDTPNGGPRPETPAARTGRRVVVLHPRRT